MCFGCWTLFTSHYVRYPTHTINFCCQKKSRLVVLSFAANDVFTIMEVTFTTRHFLIFFQFRYLLSVRSYCSYDINSVLKMFIDECWTVKKIVKKRCNKSHSVFQKVASHTFPYIIHQSFINPWTSSSLSLCRVSNSAKIWSIEVLLSIWKYSLQLLFIFQLFTRKLFITILQLTCLMDCNHKMFVRTQKLTFCIYVNKKVIQGLVKTDKHMFYFIIKLIKPASMWKTWEHFRFFKLLCTRGSLMTQITNLVIEKNLRYIFTTKW